MATEDYARGDGGYTFAPEEIPYLRDLRDDALRISLAIDISTIDPSTLLTQVYYDLLTTAQNATPNANGASLVGLVAPIYSAILADETGVETAVREWIEGAEDVNQRNGFYAEFIHTFTEVQLALRGYTDDATARTQQGSNEIGLGLAAIDKIRELPQDDTVAHRTHSCMFPPPFDPAMIGVRGWDGQPLARRPGPYPPLAESAVRSRVRSSWAAVCTDGGEPCPVLMARPSPTAPEPTPGST